MRKHFLSGNFLLATMLTLGTCHGAPKLSVVHSRGRATPPRARPTVVVVSIDGLMPSQVLQADALGARVPNLRRMVEEGAYATGVRGVLPSLTYPAHITLLTGTSPAVHGIGANIKFDPLVNNPGSWYWYAKDIRSETLWDVTRRAHLTTANVFWPVSVGAPIDYNIPQYWPTSSPEDEDLDEALSPPELLQELRDAVGPNPYGEDFSYHADEVRSEYARYLIESKHLSFMTAYMGALDGVQHHTGPNSSHALRILERIDERIGNLRDALDRVAPGRGIFIVVSDHGFLEYHTEVELRSILRRNNFIDFAPDLTVTTWRAAAWTAGGTAAIVLRDPTDQDTLSSVDKLVETMTADPHFGIDRVLQKPEIDTLGGFSGANVVLALKPGFKFGSKRWGPVLVKKIGGTHGYLPDVEAMDAAFFIVGRGIPKNYCLGRIDMRDIAPTIASLLSLKLSHSEGRNLLAALPSNINPSR